MKTLLAALTLIALPAAGHAAPHVEPALGNTVVSTYDDGRHGYLYLKVGGLYDYIGRKNDASSGKWVLTAGLGGMGGAQPLAATFAGFSSLNIECQQSRIDFRLRTRYLERATDSLEEAVRLCEEARAAKRPLSVGLLGNAADVFTVVHVPAYFTLDEFCSTTVCARKDFVAAPPVFPRTSVTPVVTVTVYVSPGVTAALGVTMAELCSWRQCRPRP